jgi:hypothetical protein
VIVIFSPLVDLKKPSWAGTGSRNLSFAYFSIIGQSEPDNVSLG